MQSENDVTFMLPMLKIDATTLPDSETLQRYNIKAMWMRRVDGSDDECLMLRFSTRGDADNFLRDYSQIHTIIQWSGEEPAPERHDRMTAWACANAIMAYLNEPKILLGEFNKAAGGGEEVDPVALAHRIRKWRRESALTG